MAGSTPNQETVTRYMDGFRHTDRDRILSCLSDDVEWQLPGMFHTRGKAEFATHIVDEGFTGKPAITVNGSSNPATWWWPRAPCGRGRPTAAPCSWCSVTCSRCRAEKSDD